MSKNVKMRVSVDVGDSSAIREIVSSTLFFNAEEIEVAVELVEERLKLGEASGYYFIFADIDGKTIAYSCYGPIPGTVSSFDLYWIAVHADYRGTGLGSLLLEASEAAIKEMGGQRIYVETSSRAQYEPTRGFYLSRHYQLEATLVDFYAPGDSKLIFVKVI